MRKLLAATVLFCGCLPVAQAGESWQAVFEDASVSVAFDSASVRRDKQIAVFRERQRFLKPQLDQASMRRIQEIQFRRQVDCTGRMLSELSRAVFSEQGALIHYEANRPIQVKWEAAQSRKDLKLVEMVCGPA